MSTTPTLDPEFARAIRDELVAIGTKKSRLQRHQRRTRALAIGVAVVAVAGATTGAAVATNLGGLTTTTAAGTPVSPAVSGANTVIVDVSCVSGTGKVSLPTNPGVVQDIRTGKIIPNGYKSPATAEFDCGTLTRTVHVTDGYLPAGSTSITITADPGTTWKATVQYGTATTTDWGVNANGQTYGAINNKNGMPDLQSVQATNGAIGYAFTKQMLENHKDGDTINVYESDGTTVIGKFHFGDPSTAAPTPNK
jgi:hypothetical protein